MAKTITQKIVFKGADAETIYNTYMNPQKHSAAIGAPVTVQAKAGSRFYAFGRGPSGLSGKILHFEKNRLITQTWKAENWEKNDPESIVVLTFENQDGDAVLEMTHVNVPDRIVDNIKNGWKKYYWEPWKKYISRQKKK